MKAKRQNRMSQSGDAGGAWRPLQEIDRRLLRDARLQAHAAVQWLARAARAYVPVLPDDAHTNLGWDGKTNAFMTRSLRDGSQLSLNIVSLTLSLHASGQVARLSLH